MTRPKILNYAPREEPQEIRRALARVGYRMVVGDVAWQLAQHSCEDAFVDAARDAVALMGTSIRRTPISRRVLSASQRLRLIAKYTVGVDDVDVEAASELGILVCHAPTEANCFAVAEHTMAAMLTLLKKVRERDAAVRAGRWRERHLFGTYVGTRQSDGFAGITIGIVGLGRIGTRLAQLLAPWRARVIAYDPYIEPARFLLAGVQPVDYETLLRQSDVLTFHVVLSKETRNMLGEKQLALMKPNAIVINMARGRLVDEAALAKAIRAERIAGAAIDAFEVEPLPPKSPLRRLGDKVLLSPHAASFTEGGELRPGIEWATRSVLTALAGEVPDNVYNKDVIPLWQERFGGVSLAQA